MLGEPTKWKRSWLMATMSIIGAPHVVGTRKPEILIMSQLTMMLGGPRWRQNAKRWWLPNLIKKHLQPLLALLLFITVNNCLGGCLFWCCSFCFLGSVLIACFFCLRGRNSTIVRQSSGSAWICLLGNFWATTLSTQPTGNIVLSSSTKEENCLIGKGLID